jgi:hypothetical protein
VGPDTVTEVAGLRVLWCDPAGPAVVGDGLADVIGSALGRADVVAVPATRLPPEFFVLRSGVAGEVVQKFATYRLHLVVVGDVGREVAGSTALRDFVREANRGRQTWFAADAAELAARLSAAVRR